MHTTGNRPMRTHRLAAGLLAAIIFYSAWAALPTQVAPSSSPAAGDWLALIKGYIKDGGLVLARDLEQADG